MLRHIKSVREIDWTGRHRSANYSPVDIECYHRGARVWVRDPETVWKGGELIKDFKAEDKTLAVELEDGDTATIKIRSKEDLPPLRNPEILIGENDLTSLSYLHEPAVLYNLNERFIRNTAIYTYCGIVLVAINPYEQLPLYGEDVIQAYHGQDMGSMDPHIFAVAEEAFKRMARFEQDQSIIVSGESGAGKTVSAKYAMRYFATVGGSSSETQVEKKVLASNPIMEAIGNAKTTRNDNSSRFGKYIEIRFNRLHHIVGANMRTYLLEKSRVVFQAPEERNYHIFYQLCACCDQQDLKELALGSAADFHYTNQGATDSYSNGHPDEFYYTSQGEAPTVDGIDDKANLEETREAFKLLGFKEDMVKQIFRIIGAVLHFGNVEIRPDQHESSKIEVENESLPILCNLLGIEEDAMRKWLCNRKIVTVQEVLTKPLRRDMAVFSRDALAKHIYAQLFSWIVDQINKAMDTQAKTTNFIGVLDIYGFEMFEINSFEQFCINYANEKLQQQFTQHVFKLEQEEYVKEKIEWSFIDYYDNQPCIDMIESKLGILDLLDEECMLPKGSDENWCNKLYNKLTSHSHFSKPRTSRTAFLVHHFADKVEYESEGFVQKNRDQVNDEHLNILMASQYEFVAELFRPKQEAPPTQHHKRGNVKPMIAPVKSTKTFKKSVGSQFRDSLTYLMMKLNSTTPHYVRCIKPNDYKLPFTFEPKRAVEQLRACGVLETIRISAAGYPSRWSYSEFFTRYRVLMVRKEINKKDVRGTSEKTLKRLIVRENPKDPDKYQFGKTKIFFRAGQVAYLEKLRADKLRAACVLMQKTVRGWMQRTKYQRLLAATIVMQKYTRAYLAKKLTKFLRETRASIIIQKTWRRYRCRRDFLIIRNATLKIQSYYRGMVGRNIYMEALRQYRATTLQRYIRGWQVRTWYRRTRRALVLLQCCVRRWKARKELKLLKIEARSVEHYKALNRGMENKIISITHKVDELNKENVRLRETEQVMLKLKDDLGDLEKVKAESKELNKTVADQETELEKLRRLLEETQTEKGLVEEELQSVMKARAEEKQQYEEESNKLKDSLVEQENKLKELEESIELQVNTAVEETKEHLIAEFEDERSRHQKLLQDYTRLEQRFDNLKEDMQAMENSPTAHMNGGMVPRHVRADSSEGAESGYGTLATTTTEDAENVEVEIEEQGEEKASMDISVFIKLQQRCRDLEKEKSKLEVQLEKRDVDGRNRTNTIENELEHLHLMNNDLKEENNRMKKDMENLRRTLEGDDEENNPVKILNNQVDVLNLENEKHRQEIVKLKTDLVNRRRQWALQEGDSVETGTNTEQHMLVSDEDLDNLQLDSSSIISDYKSVKTTNQILEKEIQALRMNYDYEKADLKEQIKKLHDDNERQQTIIGENLKLTPSARVSQAVQFELSRLTNENINLMEEKEYLEKFVKKLKKQLKAAHKRLQSTSSSAEMGGALVPYVNVTFLRLVYLRLRTSWIFRILAFPYWLFCHRIMATANNIGDVHLSGVPSEFSDTPESTHANVRVKEREEMMGMLEYKADDEPKLLKMVIIDFIPEVAEGHLPGLPAYIIFMCIRHADYVNDDRKVKSLLTGVINGIKKTVKKHFEDFEYVSFWLTNATRLLHNLKQYSGEESFSSKNTERQNEHCLRNFDLSEYRHVMNDLGIHIYQMLIRIIENRVQPMIVSAMLEGEMAGLVSSKPTGVRGRNSTIREKEVKNVSIDSLIKQLGTYISVMNIHGMDPELVKQVARQTLYLITASTINNILLRKDMCHWSKGVQIRYNLSELEEWLRSSRLYDKIMETTLEPLVQVAQLLQVKKRTDDDVGIICDTCTQLTVTQIIKILNLYTPDEYEKRTEIAFIRKVQSRLGTRDDPKRESQLLIDAKHTFPVTFPYNPSSVELNEITIPDTFHLDFLKKL
ncbi:unconventional myosin-Va-like isoform X4 [Lytechinus variegatus]|uniref:unconventional myosin-Va-like isoform X4 n=1 Tax=Lytechinus variegatus TaxID=7654 RepID=UPI001BB21827|nr:unconventional myosin-Va-like isoform X4 [Lytechinus variegatus]